MPLDCVARIFPCFPLTQRSDLLTTLQFCTNLCGFEQMAVWPHDFVVQLVQLFIKYYKINPQPKLVKILTKSDPLPLRGIPIV